MLFDFPFNLKSFDLYNELKLWITAAVLASIIVAAIEFGSPRVSDWIGEPVWDYFSRMKATVPRSTEAIAFQPRNKTCLPQSSPYDSTRRVTFTKRDIHIYAWPSRGGVIIHDHADTIDLEFLGLDPLKPPSKRLPNQLDEDVFCQWLLLLGAKWWDSEERFQFLGMAEEMDDRAIQALENETEPAPSMKERRWVSVAWPTTGGLWVAEFDTNLWGIEEDNLVPDDAARLRLAWTMDQRSQVLREHFNARFYEDVRDYKGYAFLNSWKEKETGEVGTLMPCSSF